VVTRRSGVRIGVARAATVWVSTARKAPARSSGVGSAATMLRVTLVAASGLTAAGAKLRSGHLRSVWGLGVCTDLIKIILYRADELLGGARLARLPAGLLVKLHNHHQ
jgi:hypothetical protein